MTDEPKFASAAASLDVTRKADAYNRISRFLEEHLKMAGVCRERIFSLNMATDREAVLLTDDLRTLLDCAPDAVVSAARAAMKEKE